MHMCNCNYIHIIKTNVFCLYDIQNDFLHIQAYLKHTLADLTTPGDVWSDFEGTGSDASGYASDGQNAQALGIDVSDGFKSGASYSGPCTKMDSTSDYQLDGTVCTAKARYICMKSRKLFS